MKKHILIFVLTAFLTGFITSCIDEHEQIPPFSQGATVKLGSSAGFFDQLNIDGSTVSFDVTEYSPDAISVNEIIVLKSLNGGAAVEHSRISSGTTFSVTPAQAAAGTGTNKDDLVEGDNFNFSFKTVTSGGTFTANTSRDVTVTCSSNLAGTYDALTDHFASDAVPPDVLGLTYTITLTEISPGVYGISDLTGGGWPLVYGTDDYGVNFGGTDRMGEITDKCGSISFDPTDDQFGGNIILDPTKESKVTLKTSGEVEKIEIYWADDTYADNGHVILTPQ